MSARFWFTSSESLTHWIRSNGRVVAYNRIDSEQLMRLAIMKSDPFQSVRPS